MNPNCKPGLVENSFFTRNKYNHIYVLHVPCIELLVDDQVLADTVEKRKMWSSLYVSIVLSLLIAHKYLNSDWKSVKC